MTTYFERKERALMGYSVEHRDDASLPQWFATDKWNRHNYAPELSDAPQVVGAYQVFRPTACHAAVTPFHVEPRSNALEAQAAGLHPRQPVKATVPRIHVNAPMPQADIEFGLHRVDAHHKVLELAPDQSQYVLPNRGDIGRMIFHPI